MKKISAKTNTALMTLFAVLTIIMQAAMSRAFVYGLLTETLVHVGFFLIFFVLFTVFTWNELKKRFSKTSGMIVLTGYVSVYFIMMILLSGFQKLIPALVIGIVYIAVPLGFALGKKETKRSIVCIALSIVILFGLTIPGYFYRLFEISVREKTEELYLSEEEGYFTHAVAVEKLYIYTQEPKTNAEVLFHNSLQAYTSARFSDQILYECDRNNKAEDIVQHTDTITKYYPYVEQQRIGSQDELIEKYATRITNYILYDDTDIESIFVAANLCNQKNAVMVGKSILPLVQKYGWTQVFDATGWTEEKFMESTYFDQLDRHLMFMIDRFSQDLVEMNTDAYMSQLWDVAIMNNAWIVHNTFTLVQLENHLKKLKRNSICIGSRGKNAENAVVQACARYSTTFIYTSYVANMSVLSGFDLNKAATNSDVLQDGTINKVSPTVYSDDSTPKHTVCVMLSDADNVRFCTESLRNSYYYQSPLRDENLQYNIGLAGSMVEIAPIFLLEFYDDMFPSNDFCYQLSSIGYTYPSKWTDKKAWEQVTKSLVRIMRESKTNVLEIMDDSALFGAIDLPSCFGNLEKYFDTYTCYDDVDGCLFIDYTALYSGYRGAVCWSNDKPVVSAKYSVWYDEGTPYNSEKNTIECIVNEINEMSTDKTSEDGYTFIIVHGWSGINENGDLVRLDLSTEGVDSTAIFKALQDGFDEDVEMVTTTEFINRMRRNVKR